MPFLSLAAQSCSWCYQNIPLSNHSIPASLWVGSVTHCQDRSHHILMPPDLPLLGGKAPVSHQRSLLLQSQSHLLWYQPRFTPPGYSNASVIPKVPSKMAAMMLFCSCCFFYRLLVSQLRGDFCSPTHTVILWKLYYELLGTSFPSETSNKLWVFLCLKAQAVSAVFTSEEDSWAHQRLVLLRASCCRGNVPRSCWYVYMQI